MDSEGNEEIYIPSGDPKEITLKKRVNQMKKLITGNHKVLID